MKILFDHCTQPRAYADSRGLCLIELENTESLQDVIDKFVTPIKDWWEEKYSHPLFLNKFVYRIYGKDTTYTGNLVLLQTFRVYLD